MNFLNPSGSATLSTHTRYEPFSHGLVEYLYGPAHKMLVFIAYAQKTPLNLIVNVSNGRHTYESKNNYQISLQLFMPFRKDTYNCHTHTHLRTLQMIRKAHPHRSVHSVTFRNCMYLIRRVLNSSYLIRKTQSSAPKF